MEAEKSYIEKVKELENAEDELKIACKKAIKDFINALGKKLKIDILCNWITAKMKNH
jgi:hypothetical protein